jgi:hypothetical protein
MGSVYNIVNLHLYHYAANNPVKYIDPDGKLVVTLGISGSAHAGLGVQGSTGIAISLSVEKGFDIGVYASGGIIGGGPLPAAGLGVSIGITPAAKEIHDIDGVSSTIDGGTGPINIDIGQNENANVDFMESGGIITIGAKSTPSVHVSLGGTATATLKDLKNNMLKGMGELKEAANQFIFDNIAKQILALPQ